MRNKTSERRVADALNEPIRYLHLIRLYHFGMVAFDTPIWRDRFLGHIEEVRNYFVDQNRLLVINVFETDDSGLWNELASFLGRSPLDVPFPHQRGQFRGPK